MFDVGNFHGHFGLTLNFDLGDFHRHSSRKFDVGNFRCHFVSAGNSRRHCALHWTDFKRRGYDDVVKQI